MATFKSTQLTNATAVPPTRNVSLDNADMRVRFFDFTAPTGGVAAADVIQLITLRKGMRYFGGTIVADAVASGAVMQLGDGSTAALYGEGSANALTFDFANTHALKWGEVLANDVTITLTWKTGTAGMAAGKVLRGIVRYQESAG
jgi:hypothetical protein